MDVSYRGVSLCVGRSRVVHATHLWHVVTLTRRPQSRRGRATHSGVIGPQVSSPHSHTFIHTIWCPYNTFPSVYYLWLHSHTHSPSHLLIVKRKSPQRIVRMYTHNCVRSTTRWMKTMRSVGVRILVLKAQLMVIIYTSPSIFLTLFLHPPPQYLHLLSLLTFI